jgi:hypothetical protein
MHYVSLLVVKRAAISSLAIVAAQICSTNALHPAKEKKSKEVQSKKVTKEGKGKKEERNERFSICKKKKHRVAIVFLFLCWCAFFFCSVFYQSGPNREGGTQGVARDQNVHRIAVANERVQHGVETGPAGRVPAQTNRSTRMPE